MDDSKVIELYAKYDSCRIVAEELGLAKETVRRVLIKNGVKRTGNRPKPQKKSRRKYCAAVVGMYYNILSLDEKAISIETGIPPTSVNEILVRKYGKQRKQKAREQVDMQDIERQYLDGISTYEIAEQYGVHHATISEWMIERGHKRGKGNYKPGTEAALKVAEGRRKAHEKLSENAKTRFLETYGDVYARVERHRRADFVRKKRILERPRDLGINWRTVAKRQGNMKCSICGCECNPDDKRWGNHGPTYPSVDHIQRIVDGGSDTWDNVRLVCMHCNIKLSAVMKNAKKQTA